jgi:NTP pyrophosphatase (non-canonical NTP hydrolase)
MIGKEQTFGRNHYTGTEVAKIDNGILGLIGEAGEIVDVYKKWIYQSTPGTPVPVERLKDEAGDVLWYLAEVADGMNKNLADVICADFDRLDESVAKAKTMPSIRWIILAIAENALQVEKATTEDKMRVYMHLIIEHLAQLARWLDMSMAQIAQHNIDKLKKRYPVKFDPAISEARYET